MSTLCKTYQTYPEGLQTATESGLKTWHVKTEIPFNYSLVKLHAQAVVTVRV